MRDAELLADIPLEETLVSETSSEKSGSGKDEDDDDYNSEEDKAEVERQIKRARYASQGRALGPATTP